MATKHIPTEHPPFTRNAKLESGHDYGQAAVTRSLRLLAATEHMVASVRVTSRQD